MTCNLCLRITNQRILSLEAELEELKQQQREEGMSSTNIVGEVRSSKVIG